MTETFLPAARHARVCRAGARSVTRHVARAGITELFSEVARRLLLTRFRTDDPTGVHLAELPDPLSEMGKKKGCC